MARRIELIGAGLASALALLWLLYVVHIVQAGSNVAGVTGQNPYQIDIVVFGVLAMVTVALLAGVSAGAYAHLILGHSMGKQVLAGSAGLLFVDMMAWAIDKWGLFTNPVIGNMLQFTLAGSTIVTLLPMLEVLVTACAVMSVLAAFTPPISDEKPAAERVRGGRVVPPDASAS